jgi:hypothetical protein
MTDSEKAKAEAEDIAHLWQNFRIRCLELAVSGGATDKNMIEVAEKLGGYIMKGKPAETA